jgi:hypothetical protein
VRLSLDPRAKLLVLTLINVFIVTSPDILTETAGVGLVAFAVLAMGSWRSFVKSILIYAGMLDALYLCGLFPNNPLSAFVSMIMIWYYDFCVSGGMTVEWTNTFLGFMSWPVLIGTGALAVAGAAGMLLGRVFLKKHFIKAGML